MKKFPIPVVVQPGSQPADEDGVVLDYMRMPDGPWTYSMPVIPEPEDVTGLESGLACLQALHDALAGYDSSEAVSVIELDALDGPNRELIDQVLGNGEVSIRYESMLRARIQESVLAGAWRVQYLNDKDEVERDVIEVGRIPSLVSDGVFGKAADTLDLSTDGLPPQVGNAPSLLIEIADKVDTRKPGDDAHVINLSLLPNTDEDLDLLATRLSTGPCVILSRGFGNCRITSTGLRDTWWVQFFNSEDTLILNTIEISDVPEVACAAPEDIEASAERMAEILEVYR